MITKETIDYAIKNIFQKPARSFLTILSIFVGIATIFIFISFGLGLYDYVDSFATSSTADKLIIEGRGGAAPGTSGVILDERDVVAIERTRGVLEAAGVYFRGAQAIQKRESRFIFAIGFAENDRHLLEESFNIELVTGRFFRDNSFDVILGYNYQFDDRVFPRKFSLNDRITINDVSLRVVGFYSPIGNPIDDANVYVSEETFKRLYPSDDPTYSLIIARADINQLEQAIDRVERNLARSRGEVLGRETFTVTSFIEQLEAFSASLNIVVGFIILIAFISIIVSAINTANTMVTSVLERVQEIGVLKSIGAKNKDIFAIFLLESSFLGLIAGIIGVLLGFGISSLAGALLLELGWGFLQPLYTPTLFIGLLCFATVVGAISGVIPALDASKKKPVDALRAE